MAVGHKHCEGHSNPLGRGRRLFHTWLTSFGSTKHTNVLETGSSSTVFRTATFRELFVGLFTANPALTPPPPGNGSPIP